MDRDPAGRGPEKLSARGLARPSDARSSCGVACVARVDGERLHEVVDRALVALDRIEHRGAAGADGTTGDGAGILLQLPHEFLAAHAGEFGIDASEVPEPGRVGLAVFFVPREPERYEPIERRLAEIIEAEGIGVLGWRDVPVNPDAAGDLARRCIPRFRQVLVAAPEALTDEGEFERLLYVTRRVAELELGPELNFSSFSARTAVYKGMLMASKLGDFYPDLADEALVTKLAVVHSRFSTNTAPSWELAHPLRLIAHNGEINTFRGNVNWMRAREPVLASEVLGDDLARCLPLINEEASDSDGFDRVLELLTISGRSLPHALMMMIPSAFEGRPDVPEELADFYRYHSCLLEPWDGPAAIVASDGRELGATLDRNGLRPARWMLTSDDWFCLSSESGTFSAPPEDIVASGRLRPGHLLMVDFEDGRIRDHREVELEVAGSQPYGEWNDDGAISLSDLPEPPAGAIPDEPLRERQLAFGYTQEDMRVLLAPLVRDGKEPTGSMGQDVSLAVFSEHQPSLFAYFKQRFAQVTNPAIDSVREHMVMSLETSVGPQENMLAEGPEHTHRVLLPGPVLSDQELEKLRRIEHPILSSATLDTTWPLEAGGEGLPQRIDELCAEADAAVAGGATQVILSDRAAGPERVPIPSLLATAALQHHLVRAGTRLRVSLLVESGEPREVFHLAALIGYGATAVNPYLMLESIHALDGRAALGDGLAGEQAWERALRGIDKGLLKIMSKMGISTIRSYRGAQIFEAIGLDDDLIEQHFKGTPSRISGIGLPELAREAVERHARAYPEEHGLALPAHLEAAKLPGAHENLLPQGGVFQWRRDGERHMWDPATVASLQRSVRDPDAGQQATSYDEFRRLVDEENSRHALLRGLLSLKTSENPIPVSDVEPVSEIVKRFSTGAMSLGALSPEAHETLAIAMNRLGAWSNSGEGGEDRRRNSPDANGDSRRSRIRQVASGRFGVDGEYLSRADQIQIKISQGAKPGEGGQLPGHKVDTYIAELRFSTPGVELISPPPHHDIYSIEDLKQLIYDLRSANPAASVSVKLAAESGVGTVAAGVAKAGADHIVIAGHDGGTGASPMSSIHSAGVPWEIGIAETQQVLIESGLRTRTRLQTDGQMRTGRDVVIAALLGADEVGLSTAPLIATGCVMMRVCHLNTCPVGVATQDPELRQRFSGTPDHVVTYLMHVAEETRELMAALGIARFEDMVGQTHLLETGIGSDHWKTGKVDLSPLLFVPDMPAGEPRHHVEGEHARSKANLESLENREIAPRVAEALDRGDPIRVEKRITNVDLALGGLTSLEVVKRHGVIGLPADTVRLEMHGSAGQSAGAWLAPGVTLALDGEVNDYAGKGLSGGILAVRPSPNATFVAEENVIAGNVCLYGATRGKAFFRGIAGERFAVRNSGADAVVEGIGDHGCEYMTGGKVVIIGPTGENFAAGMSGGVAFVHDPDSRLPDRANHELVDLEPLPANEGPLLRNLLEEHLERTGSAVAAGLLERWDEALPEFVRVISRRYKRVIQGDPATQTLEVPA